MGSLFKLLIFGAFFLFIFVAGYKLYLFLSKKINGSKTGWELLGFTLLLFGANALLLFGGLYALIEVYGFLAANKE